MGEPPTDEPPTDEPPTEEPPTEEPPTDEPCTEAEKKTAEEQLEKSNFRFEKYRALWLDDRFPRFSVNMQTKLEKLASKMLTKYKQYPEIVYCDKEDDADVDRFDQTDPCKGASQVIASYKRWA